jgi:hypothetical protein
MVMEEEKKLKAISRSGRLAGIAKLIVEHGIPRVLVAAGIAIPVSFLVEVPSEDWQINIALLILSLSMIVIGSLIRIFEMKYGVFSGRTVLLRCRNCGEAITSGVVALGNKPPQLIQCNRCQAVNIVQ